MTWMNLKYTKWNPDTGRNTHLLVCGSEVVHGMVSESTMDRGRKGVDRQSTVKHRGE